MAFPFLEDNGYSRFPDALDGAKAKAHIIAINGKSGFTGIDVRRQDLDAHIAADTDIPADFSATVITLLRKAAIYSTG